MLNNRLAFLAVIALALAAPAAHAGINIGVLADGNFTKPSYSTTPSAVITDPFNMKFGYGGGLSFEVGLLGLGVEVDALYLVHKYDYSQGTAQTITQNGLQVPVLVRFSFPVVSIGVGGYYEKFLGNLNGSVTGDADYNSSGLNAADAGLIGSLRADFAGWLVEGRYTYGLTNALTPAQVATTVAANAGAITDVSERYTTYQVLVGYRFGMGR